ncbi:MAG: YibE/F family protein [Acidimicrobiia bacterium]|nr:YibE/F family protein [Acidimicrobiia bacterium]
MTAGPRDRHSHSHDHEDDRPLPDRLHALASRRILLGAVLAVAAATLVGLVVLWPEGSDPVVDGEQFFGERVNATITASVTEDCSFSQTPGQFACDQVDFTVTSGTPAGETGSLELPLDAGGAKINDGDDVVLFYDADAPSGVQFQFADFQRRNPMLVLGLAFVAAVVALGRWRGLLAVVGVVISLVVLIGFVLPALLAGEPPLAVALTGTSLIALVALYLAHGVSERTTVAVLGTFASLLLTCLLGVVFIDLTHVTGLTGEEVGFLQAFGGNLDFRGLLLAGLVIGALGVLDDVTVTQVSAVWELHESDPDRSARSLYRAGLRIGRDHVASTVNTLVLAYAGASLPLLLLFRTADQRLGDVLTGESIAVEVVRALVGSIGLVASVPITTGLAALVVTRGSAPRAPAPSRGPRPAPAPAPEPSAPSWDDFGPDERDDPRRLP